MNETINYVQRIRNTETMTEALEVIELLTWREGNSIEDLNNTINQIRRVATKKLLVA